MTVQSSVSGTPHPYQDQQRDTGERVADLLGRMTLEEKAGQLFHAMVTMGQGGALADDPARAPGGTTARQMVTDRHMTHFNLLGAGSPGEMARWHNRLQETAADTRLGIPVTVSTDPRHAFTDNPGAAMAAGPFSQWPEALGLAATGDPDLVRAHADAVRQEYLAVGLRVALHPQIDLATEPRWSRISGTFGEDADLTSRLVTAYIAGLQGPGGTLGPDSVAAVVKHFPGGGPQKDGEDPHFPYGREQVYPGGRFDYHLRPFTAAIAAGATQMMPYYGMPVGTEHEEVGFGFNRGIVTGLLRERLGFTGIVVADWGLITDSDIMGEPHPARAWGVEHLAPAERLLKALHAGVDQFGGEHCTDLLVDLVRGGRLDESRVDASVARLLAEKFRLGLFDDRRHVDPDAAEEIVGRADLRAAGASAQRRSITLLKNGPAADGPLLPLTGRPRLHLQGVAAEAVGDLADVVADPRDADLAVLRLSTPHEPRPGLFESFFHGGRLDFPEERLKEILALLDTVRTIVVIRLERPAVIPEISDRAAALLADYGADDRAVLDVLFGRAEPGGRLPFQLPRSMAEVAAGRPDVPQESPDPLYPFGHGLAYRSTAP
ncbi:glycoside hydrolase family 3 protein [Streptomyces heilongjiangensis]|uniref:beta-glucosidase n=1 Tax=Streptomyces heilongjiangensis TaxID=945052 RepID=A0ABW1BJ88_9ACTN|nr:glycoside hydrolase family 3 N-terminal domain-containing protein [Streptomyces heilongjiangensis]MDC2951966.1 glycoside hydrolase family 3 N-terminal domain-containing protein [Streptomyces heilongjiangensis]